MKVVSVADKNETGGIWVTSPGGLTTDAALTAAVKETDLSGIVFNAVPNQGDISFNVGELYLDADPTPITSVNDLPAGFTITSCHLVFRLGNSLLASPDTYAAQFQPAESIDISGTQGIAPIYSYDEVHPLPVPSNVHLFTELPGVTFECSFVAGSVNTSLTYIQIIGTYEINNFSWALENNSPVDTGDSVTITTDPTLTNPLDPTQILTVDIDYTDESGNPQTINVPQSEWTLITFFFFIFTLPTIPPEAKILTINITSTQFTGTVPLGVLTTIYFTGASGIYKLVRGKTNDTMYNVIDPDGGTVDVKIPDPFIKTGFIGG